MGDTWLWARDNQSSDFAESSLHLENSKCRLLFKGFNAPKQPAPVFAVSPKVQAAFGAIIPFG